MKISLVTVSYNSDQTIRTTLDSVASQGYSDLEYIIVDGGSCDATRAVVEDYPELVTAFVSEPDDGIYDAMNKGVKRATGDVIGILNSDDFYLGSQVLKEVAALFHHDPGLEVVLGGVDFVNEFDLKRRMRKYAAGNFEPWMLRFGLMPPHPGVFVRRSVYERIGLFKSGYKIAADFEWLTRLFLVDRANYQVVHKTWVRMREGGISTRGLKSNIISTIEMKRALQENGFFGSYFFLIARLPLKLFTQVLRS